MNSGELALITDGKFIGETVEIRQSYPELNAHSVVLNNNVYIVKNENLTPVRGRYILIGIVKGITKIVGYAKDSSEFNDIVAGVFESGAQAELWIDRLTGEEICQ